MHSLFHQLLSDLECLLSWVLVSKFYWEVKSHLQKLWFSEIPEAADFCYPCNRGKIISIISSEYRLSRNLKIISHVLWDSILKQLFLLCSDMIIPWRCVVNPQEINSKFLWRPLYEKVSIGFRVIHKFKIVGQYTIPFERDRPY